MIEFHGKPFLEYLLEMLREQGFHRILLLLGYLPNVITEYFGDGRKFGLDIAYAITSPDDGTALRLRLARQFLDPLFLLLYCDNYWPLQFENMWEEFKRFPAPAMVTIYRNEDGYTRDNVIVDEEGYVTTFDRLRTASNLQGVEISYALISKEILGLLPNDSTTLFEEAIYPKLSSQHQLRAFQTHHRYYSVGNHERLPITEQFLARKPFIILDRDGVLNEKPAQAQYVTTWDQFHWLPKAKQALRLLKKAGYTVLVVSNQAGIGRGVMSESDLQHIHSSMKKEAEQAGGAIDAIYHCPHNWDDGCECRKPKPGMLFQAQRDFHIDLTRTYFIGDDQRDQQAAQVSGCRSRLVTKQESLYDIICTLLDKTLQSKLGTSDAETTISHRP